jgi:hypothetical protein
MTLWKVDVARSGKRKKFKSLYFIGLNPLHVSHLISEYVYQRQRFDFDVDIVGISSVKGSGKIENAEFDDDEMDGDDEMSDMEIDMPYRLYEDGRVPNEVKGTITCTCGNKQNMAFVNFNFTKCHDCSRIIFRKDISNVGGLFVYSPSN